MMDTDHPVPELMRRRKSVRTYAQRPLPAPLLDTFQAALEAARRGPLGSRCRFALFDVRGPAGRELAPMGTYGLIRGARFFFSGAVKRSGTDLEDFGYLFETLVLKATDIGLATCWLGASFDRSGYGRLLDAAPDERVPAASPLGLATGKANPVDMAIRLAAGSKRRKPPEELFFDRDFEHPLNPAQAGAAALCLEMVRLAPSARNRQPWRIVREENRFHFFLARSGPPRNTLDLARVDLGIAMCHFDLTARWLGLVGGFAAERPPRATGALATGARATGARATGVPEYIITWKGNIS